MVDYPLADLFARSDFIQFKAGIWSGSTMVHGIGGSTRMLFVNAIVSVIIPVGLV